MNFIYNPFPSQKLSPHFQASSLEALSDSIHTSMWVILMRHPISYTEFLSPFSSPLRKSNYSQYIVKWVIKLKISRYQWRMPVGFYRLSIWVLICDPLCWEQLMASTTHSPTANAFSWEVDSPVNITSLSYEYNDCINEDRTQLKIMVARLTCNNILPWKLLKMCSFWVLHSGKWSNPEAQLWRWEWRTQPRGIYGFYTY